MASWTEQNGVAMIAPLLVQPVAPADVADFLAADSPASSTLTRELLGWHPAQPGLIDDLDKGHYFQNPSAPSRNV